jgi:SYP7 family syntaxin
VSVNGHFVSSKIQDYGSFTPPIESRMPFGAKKEEDVTSLLAKLYELQEDVGAKPKTSAEEKIAKAQNIQAVDMGKGRGGKKSGSQFLNIKSSLVQRLQGIHHMLEETGSTTNSKEIIAKQAEVREEVRQAQDEWNELNSLYKSEAKKKRSKFTPEELEIQQTLVQRLSQELEKAKEVQMKGYIGRKATNAPDINMDILNSINVKTLDPDAGTGKQNNWAANPNNAQMAAVTEGQQMQLQQLQERDQDFDRQIDQIGEGIQDLAEIAQMQGEEVQRQNVMLDNLNNKIEDAQEHMTNVNLKMKETLQEVGRSSDKLCVDIICIVLVIGFAAVFYNFARGNV